MKYFMLYIVLLMTGAVSAEIAPTADFYVSTSGSDGWSGRLPVPNAQGSDGPFATLTHASDAVRDLKDRQPSKDIVVFIREGFCRLSETVVFGLEDSGEGDELSNIKTDIGETTNLIEQQPERVQEMEKRLINLLRNQYATLPPLQDAYQATVEKSLGQTSITE